MTDRIGSVVFLGGPSVPTEVSRVRHHLIGAERVLARRDESQLSISQRTNRRRIKGLLAEYRSAGQFPTNEDFPNRRVPYFRDRRGTLCATAFLLERYPVRAVASSRHRTNLR